MRIIRPWGNNSELQTMWQNEKEKAAVLGERAEDMQEQILDPPEHGLRELPCIGVNPHPRPLLVLLKDSYHS